MMQASARMDMDELSGSSLVGRLIELAASPELRVNFAIAQAAKRARRKRDGKVKMRSEVSPRPSERSGTW